MATLTHSYRSVLEEYVESGHEGALLEAYEFGRRMMDQGMGVLDVVRVHNEVMEAVHADPAPSHEPGVLASRAGAVLSEALAPFEMAYRGFAESNATLARLNDSLERQVAERTEGLQRTLAAYEEADAERRRLLARVVTAQEEERRRIADDLHDDSIQAITAVGLRLSALRARLVEQVDEAQLERMESTVTAAIGRLRHLLFELRPPALDSEGLTAALESCLASMSSEAGFSYRIDNGLADELPPEQRELLYRIAHEALVNARKHARADHLSVTIEPEGQGVLARVVDDGIGFEQDAAAAARPGHLGLSGMQDRAAMAGGWCRVTPTPSRGTTVSFWLPLSPPAEPPEPGAPEE